MQIPVRLFAEARRVAGQPDVTVDLSDPATVADLKRALARAHPSIQAILSRSMIAVDSEYAQDQDVIHPRSEVAVIPPVSGGAA